MGGGHCELDGYLVELPAHARGVGVSVPRAEVGVRDDVAASGWWWSARRLYTRVQLEAMTESLQLCSVQKDRSK